MTFQIRCGDALDLLRAVEPESLQCCVTSPPYWGLRDYGTADWEGGDPGCDHKKNREFVNPKNTLGPDGHLPASNAANQMHQGQFRERCRKCGARRVDQQLGLERTPEHYVARLVEVMREVRRVLRKDGTLWLNLGDSFAGSRGNRNGSASSTLKGGLGGCAADHAVNRPSWDQGFPGLKPKDLVGIPWRVAFALQADGWWLRSDIIWAKKNCMPESVTDRPTKAHEYLFLLTRSAQYFYDAQAIAEPALHVGRVVEYDGTQKNCAAGDAVNDRRTLIDRTVEVAETRNARSVWFIATQPFPKAHFAVMPPELARRCILAGSSDKGSCDKCGAPMVRQLRRIGSKPYRTGKSEQKAEEGLVTAFSGYEDGSSAPSFETVGWKPSCNCGSGTKPCLVLDPFCGAGTTGLVALREGRRFLGFDLNPDYCRMATRRLEDDAPLFQRASEEITRP